MTPDAEKKEYLLYINLCGEEKKIKIHTHWYVVNFMNLVSVNARDHTARTIISRHVN